MNHNSSIQSNPNVMESLIDQLMTFNNNKTSQSELHQLFAHLEIPPIFIFISVNIALYKNEPITPRNNFYV